jgi:hypothetical protein
MSRTVWSVGATNVGVAAVPGILPGRSVVFAGLLLVSGVVPASAQFSAWPVIMELRPGAEATARVITVRNESASPLQLQVYGGDFDQTEDGGHTFVGLGEHERSCASRLEILPDHLNVGPHATGEVRIRMERGDSTCWSMVFVQGVARGGTGFQIAQRIGVKVYGVSAGATREGEVRAAQVVDGPDGSRHLEVAFANTGTAPLRAEGELEVRSETGAVVTTVPIAAFSILPDRINRTRVPLTASLPSDAYILIPILDFGGDYLAAGQALLEIEGS